MQLLLIFGIVFAIAAVLFALQNNALVTVTVALWHFESTLAVVLLLAIGLGVLITGLVSTPTVLRGQWSGARLRRQVAALEKEKAALEQRIAALEAEAARNRPLPLPDAEPERFAELKSILTGGEQPPKPPAA
jgi:uncharacterized integral membrane protein